MKGTIKHNLPPVVEPLAHTLTLELTDSELKFLKGLFGSGIVNTELGLTKMKDSRSASKLSVEQIRDINFNLFQIVAESM